MKRYGNIALSTDASWPSTWRLRGQKLLQRRQRPSRRIRKNPEKEEPEAMESEELLTLNEEEDTMDLDEMIDEVIDELDQDSDAE